MPGLAAAASWIESYKMPLREIRRRYTRSEMFIAGWRSQEMAANMHRSFHRNAVAPMPEQQNAAEDALEQRLGPTLLEKGIDESGEVDLRNLTGDEALRFMGSFGIKVQPGIKRN